MSRYRKIEVRTWADERFRGLSPIQPSGQGLWFFLLTGPHTGPIPGLFRAGRAAMAEELDWGMEAFDKAFQEVSEHGMAKADFKARLVWLPNALKHNKPESPNVVRSWRVEMELLPECDLKNEAIERIRENLESIGPSYVAAFDEVVSYHAKKPAQKPSGKPSPKTMPNQEQEQEQERTPLTPLGEGGVELATPSKKRERKTRVSLKTFIDRCQAAGEKAVSDYQPLLEYVEATGLPMEFVQLAWNHFKREHLPPGANHARLQADWRRHFLNYVEKGYYRLWYAKPDGGYSLTTVGVQAQRLHAEEVEHAA